MEQRHVDFSFDFEAEMQQQITDGAVRYLRNPVGFVNDLRRSLEAVGPKPMDKKTIALLAAWDQEAEAFAAFLETLDATEIRHWEENLQQQRAC